ncbi:MAG TPA: SRPBCC domain-containing protein [Candidatus Cybelea sp.]|nr:SRPBCC domain-containing protein [Candidatus Cybelea sp.]
MSNTRTPIAPALVLRRTYAAPRQRVFDAWTTPELAVKFLGPSDVTVPEIQMDVRTGGTYKIGMLMTDGERWYVGGTYREVRPPERLVMTWRWEEDKPEDEHESLLTLEFNERDGGTELVLTHEQFATDESRDGHEKGWAEILDKLGTLL